MLSVNSSFLVLVVCCLYLYGFDLTASSYSETRALRLMTLVRMSYEIPEIGLKKVRNMECEWCRYAKTLGNYNEVYAFDINEIEGVIVVDVYNKAISVGFAGSNDLDDWISNVKMRLVNLGYPGCETNCRVHRGFRGKYHDFDSSKSTSLGSYIALKINELKNRYPSYSIEISGHSAGAAAATFAALDLAVNHNHDISDLYTFASPKVGNTAFVNFFQSKINTNSNSFRITHYKDPVVQVPAKWQWNIFFANKNYDYKHIPHEIYYGEFAIKNPKNCDDFNGVEDKTCAAGQCNDGGIFSLFDCTDLSLHGSQVYMGLFVEYTTDCSAIGTPPFCGGKSSQRNECLYENEGHPQGVINSGSGCWTGVKVNCCTKPQYGNVLLQSKNGATLQSPHPIIMENPDDDVDICVNRSGGSSQHGYYDCDFANITRIINLKL